MNLQEFKKETGITEVCYQLGKKSLFIVELENGEDLYSYTTKVGILRQNVWQLTVENYSATTTKQLNWFAIAARKEGYGIVRTHQVFDKD